MGRVLLGAVGVLALQAIFILGYLTLAPSDPLVEKGIQKVVVCGEPRERGARMYEITEEVPGADSGTWGTDSRAWDTPRGGYCKVWRHYAPGGLAD
jgi:hypothetical protein